MSQVEMYMPVQIGNYTDFYASIYHATNIGKMFRPDQPLMPNYKWVPIGYHGRASSIVVSGTPIRRPVGQTKDDSAEAPAFGPSKVLDYELEVGFLVGDGNEQGRPIKITEAEDRIFGLCLVNDWSARDIQRWEYQPLGPFLSKSFATTISPWIVTMEALAPFRAPAFKRPSGDPEPLPYLDSPENRERGGFDIKLEVFISTEQMREKGVAPRRLSASNTRDLYWTFAQMLTHHTSNGCNMQTGDLIASGTVSGATKESLGCLIELTGRGAEPIDLPAGETRRFLQDGDEVIFRGYCEREGFRRIGFGECRGIVAPAMAY
jgi:fumarylacetoacetase